ncbi:DNA polymerase III subunit delta' [Persephonella sp.]
MKILGHEESKEIIRLYLDKNYSSYSFLFEGKDCIGKKLIALKTARAFLCEKNYGFGCGECNDCRLVNNTISNIYEKTDLTPHPDLKIISPENNKEIKINQIREAIQFLKLKSKKGKVIIIEKAEKMNTEASNAVLKTLEEPPENSLIILTTSNQNAILPTILSRCKKIKFKPLKKEDIFNLLKLKGVEENKAKILTALSEGSMCLPAKIMENENLFKYAKDLYNLLAINSLHPESIINLAELMDKFENQEIFTVFDILERILHRKTLKGEISPELYEDFLTESRIMKKAIEKGVKKKLAIEGLYFNLKT